MKIPNFQNVTNITQMLSNDREKWANFFQAELSIKLGNRVVIEKVLTNTVPCNHETYIAAILW